MSAVTSTDFADLKLVSRGKVRDVYATSDPDALLFVATDRISAFDVVLKNGISGKGKVLTELSLFWFDLLKDVIPNHLITANVDEMPQEVQKYKDVLEGRAMLVKRAKVVPIEAIVRGYITGSAWSEYKKSGTVHGIALPAGLHESEKFPEPLFTPSTKADAGEHDENIHPSKVAEIVGSQALADKIAAASLKLYAAASAHALSRGVILADTKFEFGLIPSSSPSSSPDSELQLILVDEVLTPDSSRYWPLSSYSLGASQPSFDKQYLRGWMLGEGFKKGLEAGPNGEGWVASEEVVRGTAERYAEAVRLLKGPASS